MQHDFVGSPVASQDYGPVLGTPFKVFLLNGVHEGVDATGKEFAEIVDLPGLIAAVVQSRAFHPRKFSGDDLKYIRSALALKSSEVAEVLEISPEHYSRCETGVKTLSAEKEKIYRMFVFLGSMLRDRRIVERLSKKDVSEASQKYSPEEAQEALSAMTRIFLEMELETLYEAGSRPTLEFSFSRHPLPRKTSGDDSDPPKKEKWLIEPEREAA